MQINFNTLALQNQSKLLRMDLELEFKLQDPKF